jgi:transcriptional regulator with XRE-family HTH domain
MSEMVLSNNLRQLMRIHENLSVSDLAKVTSIPQPTLHHILSGATKNPRRQLLEKLAGFFSVSTEQLMVKDKLPNIIPEQVKENLKIDTVPIIKWDQLKTWPIAKGNKGKVKEILLNKKIAENSFALVAEDDSLEPTFPQDSLLIFNFTNNPLDRDFVIIHMADDDTILFNRLFIDNSENYIKQDLNDGNAKLLKLDSKKDRIIGRLIEVRIQY